MSHRGPDGRGVFIEDSVVLGHRRLAIIDLTEGGRQPMTTPDSHLVIIYNGELYNYKELKQELISRDYTFETESDTEVLLKMYLEKGSNCLNLLNGMFAFIIWDSVDKRLFITRDRFGIKPLYYYETEEIIAFASEIKSLIPLVSNLTPSDEIIYDYLAMGRVDHLNDTFFADIKRFPAGSYAEITEGVFTIVKWYDSQREINRIRNDPVFKKRDVSEHISRVGEIFRDAVKLRLRSDVPVGSCLSGGLDSSGIVAIASELVNPSEKLNFQTYSAVYDVSFDQDESKYISIMNEACGTQGNFTTPTVKHLQDDFSHFIYHQEEPVPSSSVFSQYLVMKLAHENGAKVILDGQGADEIFAGYDYMVGYYLAELIREGRIITVIREIIAQTKRRNIIGIKTGAYQFAPTFIRQLFTSKTVNYLKAEFKERFSDRNAMETVLYKVPSLNQALINHLSFKLQHLLRFEDRNAMAFSVETRVPFLDPHLVHYICALSSRLKIRNGVTKWIYRAAMKGLLPSLISQRTDKIGFATPQENWMSSEELYIIKDLRNNPHPLLSKYIDLYWLRTIVDSDMIVRKMNHTLLFRVICLQVWLKTFFPVNNKI